MEKSISHTLCMSYVKLTVRQESLIRCSNKGDYQLFCHGRNDWETKFERSWTAVLKNAKHATVQLHTLGIGDANYKRDGKWAYNRRNNIYSTRTRANASRVSNGELERNERQGCLSGWLNFRRQPKDRFCGIIFNEPWSHFQEKERERERERKRERLWASLANGGCNSARECPLAFTSRTGQQACSLDGVSLWIRVRCPPVILVSSWTGFPLLLSAANRHPTSSLPARACACAHAYTARRIFSFFFFLFFAFFFRRSAENWPNVHREGIQSGIKRHLIAPRTWQTPFKNEPPCVTLWFRIS